MGAFKYKRHFMLLSAAVIVLHLGWRWLVWSPATDIRDLAAFSLPGVLHALAFLLSLEQKVRMVRSAVFVALTLILSLLAPSFGLLLFSLLPWAVMKPLLPFLAEIGDSNLQFAFASALASACGAVAYWLLIRMLWFRSLRYRELLKTIPLCMIATLVGFFGVAAFRTPANYDSTKELAGISPIASWWFAFSWSLFLHDCFCNDFRTRSSASSKCPELRRL